MAQCAAGVAGVPSMSTGRLPILARAMTKAVLPYVSAHFTHGLAVVIRQFHLIMSHSSQLRTIMPTTGWFAAGVRKLANTYVYWWGEAKYPQ